jgi:hypothetical protein
MRGQWIAMGPSVVAAIRSCRFRRLGPSGHLSPWGMRQLPESVLHSTERRRLSVRREKSRRTWRRERKPIIPKCAANDLSPSTMSALLTRRALSGLLRLTPLSQPNSTSTSSPSTPTPAQRVAAAVATPTKAAGRPTSGCSPARTTSP